MRKDRVDLTWVSWEREWKREEGGLRRVVDGWVEIGWEGVGCVVASCPGEGVVIVVWGGRVEGVAVGHSELCAFDCSGRKKGAWRY